MTTSPIITKLVRCTSWLRESVTVKVMVVVMAALALVIGIYSHLLLKSREQWLRDQLIDSQRTLNRSLMQALHENPEDGHRGALNHFLATLERRSPHLEVRVLNGESRVVFSSEAGEVGQMFGDEVGGAAAQGSRDRSLRTVASLPVRASCRQCHVNAGQVMGNIIVDFPPDAIEKPLQRDRLYLTSYAIAILFMVGGIVLLLMWSVVHNPLSRLADSVRGVQEGDLDSRCAIEGKDQFHELGEGFNAMVESIARQRAELEGLHARQIAQADRLASIGKLASGLAHEIKNPLHGIGSALTVVARRVNDPSLQEIVVEIQDQTKRVTDLLNDMLAYARPSRPAFEELRLDEIVEKTLVLLQADLRDHNLQIVREYEEQLPTVEADPSKLQQILLNLLLNAIQASECDGVIFVCLQRAGDDGISIRVQDNGPGIGPELAEHIFEPFYTTKSDGNGLGLAITRTLVEQHQGTLRIVQNQRHGACFEIVLPLQHASEPHAPTS